MFARKIFINIFYRLMNKSRANYNTYVPIPNNA